MGKYNQNFVRVFIAYNSFQNSSSEIYQTDPRRICLIIQSEIIPIKFLHISVRIKYRISANSFRGIYSFFNLALCTVTVHKSAETIQGRKLFKGGNYLRKYDMCDTQYLIVIVD